MTRFDAEITRYYDRFPESTRLETGPGQLEFARTLELIERYAPPPPAQLLDVGGGPGAYAIPLADRGYEVHLIEPVPRLLDQARRRSQSVPKQLASCTSGDARRLDWSSDTVDVVLLLGPLYHLTDGADRKLALSEAHRVLRPNGVVFAAAISRFASTLDGLRYDVLSDPEFAKIVERDLESGQHRNPTERIEFFTTAYFHHPDELRGELNAAAFRVEGVYGLEGPGWLLQDFDRRWADPQSRHDLLRVARALECEPSMSGVSAHLLGVARKGGEGEEGGRR